MAQGKPTNRSTKDGDAISTVCFVDGSRYFAPRFRYFAAKRYFAATRDTVLYVFGF
jgi:hypothetical protein